MALRQFGAAAAVAATLALATPAYAVTEIQWWHAMTGPNNDVVVKLANDFNASQNDYRIIPSFKGSYADVLNAGIAAFRAGNAPGIMQVFEVGTATMMAAKGAVKPVSELMKEQGEAFDPKSYLPAITGYYSTSKGDMLSFPFNSSSMVMWVNLDALKKADIATPPKTWPEVFAAAKKLHATSPTCGFSSAWGSWGLIEQFSAWHNVPMGSKANGLDGFDTVLAFNTPLETKLLENIAELQKDKSYDYSGRTNTGEGRFTSGECPMFMTSSAFYPNVKANAKFSYTAVPMPYTMEQEIIESIEPLLRQYRPLVGFELFTKAQPNLVNIARSVPGYQLRAIRMHDTGRSKIWRSLKLLFKGRENTLEPVDPDKLDEVYPLVLMVPVRS